MQWMFFVTKLMSIFMKELFAYFWKNLPNRAEQARLFRKRQIFGVVCRKGLAY